MSERPTPETDATSCSDSVEMLTAQSDPFALYQKLCEATAKIDQWENDFDLMKRERDEARELLRILAGLVAYGLGQSGEEWSLEAMRQATTAIQNAKEDWSPPEVDEPKSEMPHDDAAHLSTMQKRWEWRDGMFRRKKS